jgi:hypothetical protein
MMRFVRRWLVAASYVLVFLDSAQAQPVNFGETAVLSAADGQNANLLLAQVATLSEAATVQSLSFYVTAASGNLILGIYDATGPSGGPGALKASTKSFAPTKGWNTAKVVTPVALAAGSYWLAYLPSSNSLGFVKTNVTGNCKYYSLTFGSLPSKFSTSPASCNPTIWSFYATATADSTSSSAVAGACGSSNGATVSAKPTANLCTTGAASTVSGSGPWSWTCAGSDGGSTASCSDKLASTSTPAVAGACGSSNGATVSAKPTANLCTTGTASAVSGSGPWSWSCAGSNGGSTATCSDKLASTGSSGTTSGSSTGPTGLLPAARDASANWKTAGMLSAGGIPTRTTVCATIKPRGSGQDDTTNIQNAVNACPAGQVVSLSAGTFTVTEGNFILVSNGITLRGAGPCAGNSTSTCTLIQRTNGCQALSPSSNGNCGSNPSPFIIIGPEEYNNWVTSTNLTADAAQGASSVHVASASGFAVGQMVLLDEMSNAGWQPDVGVGGSSQVWAASDYRVTWEKHNPSQSFDDFSSGQYPYQNNTAGCWFSTPAAPSGTNQRCDRTTSEIKKISAISGTTITFDSPITISYRVANTAQLSYYQMAFTANAGVESMTLSGADNGALWFQNAVNSWAYRVECTVYLGHGCIQVGGSLRVQLEQFYVHDGAWPEPGGGGYAIGLCCSSTEVLIENGIALRADKVIASFQSGAGSVTAYNYMDQAFICCDSNNPASGSDGWIENGLNNGHYTGSHHMLFEGNFTHQMGEDETHGNSIYNTYFRNYSTGYRLPSWVNAFDGATINDLTGSPQGTPGPRTPAETQLYTYWETFMGNVLGYPNYSTSVNGWIYADTNSQGGPAIFGLGEGYTSGNNGPDPKAGFDTNGKGGTTIAHGNYDYLQSKVTWDPNISSETLPNSMYLSSKPAFFTTGSGYTWPWVNPTGTPQVYQNCAGGSRYCLPAKARYDAGTPFTQP